MVGKGRRESEMFRFYFVIIMNLFRLPYILPKLNYMIRHTEKYSLEKRYAAVKKLIRIMKRTGTIFTRSFGSEQLPKEGGYIMFANHQGKYDALGVLHTHTKPCSIVMDEARSHTILTSQVIDLVDGKRIKKDDLRQSMQIILEMVQETAKGKIFLIFPEGGYFYNKKNTLSEFKAGCFKSAMKAKVPIVPVVLIDSYKAFEGFYVSPIRTQVHYLKPIPYEEYQGMKTVEIAELVKVQIEEKIEEVLAERQRRYGKFFGLT